MRICRLCIALASEITRRLLRLASDIYIANNWKQGVYEYNINRPHFRGS